MNMRATEFITEESKAVKYGGLLLKYAFNDSALIMKAFDPGTRNPLAYVKFHKENEELYPQDLWVNDEHRNKGIAKSMYDYLKSDGYAINRSHDQTKAGSGFWDKHRGEDSYVWEDEIKLPDQNKAKAWIDKVYQQFPQTWQNNHVMPMGGEGENQQFAMFELVPSMSKKGAVEVKWFQAYPLRQGVGGRAMQELQRLAREDGVGLTLFPWAHGQVSQPKLTKFYKSQGFKPAMKGSKSLSWDHELDEGWKDWVAGAAMGAAALAPQAIDAKPIQPTQKPAIVQPAQQAPQGYNVLSNNSTNEITLQKAARRAGMKGAELAQFMAQMKHESWDFDRMKEKAQPGVKDYYAKRYDMKYSPKTAKILGNKHAGDGARYHGRGFVQLTGRDNYRMASDALGIDLLKNPELASKPEVAAKIAVWYWNTRVKPNVRNFADTASVTKYINPAARGLENRDSNFKDYMRII